MCLSDWKGWETLTYIVQISRWQCVTATDKTPVQLQTSPTMKLKITWKGQIGVQALVLSYWKRHKQGHEQSNESLTLKTYLKISKLTFLNVCKINTPLI